MFVNHNHWIYKSFIRTYRHENPTCSRCKKEIRGLAVGHFKKDLKSFTHLVHEDCQQAKKDQKRCSVCKKKFNPLPPLSKIKRVFLDSCSYPQHYEPLRSWEDGIRVLHVPDDDLLLKATEEQLQILSGLMYAIDREKLEWFINLSESDTKAFRPLGRDGMDLSESDCIWFLEQSAMRQEWIVSYCSPYYWFISEQREWMDSLTDEEMRKTAPLLDKIIPFLEDWSCIRIRIDSKRWLIDLILQMRGKENLPNLLKIESWLREEDKAKLRQIYAQDTALYHVVKQYISPQFSEEDRQWFDKLQGQKPSAARTYTR